MKKLILILLVLVFSLPFDKWLALTPDEHAEVVQLGHMLFHQNNPDCEVSAGLGVPRKEVRRFRRDKNWIDFYVECVKERGQQEVSYERPIL